MIEDGKVVRFHYILSDASGTELERSADDAPMTYLHGADNIIPGLETALAGKAVGDSFEITLEPAQAYGERDESLTQRLSAKYLRHAGKLRPGMQVPVQTDQGQRWVTVLKVGLKTVDVDANHPFAGKTLNFSITISDVRDATDEEKAHGHAHGPGGHQH